LKVLGKDQESADDRPPTEDHAHLSLNTQAIIDELFSPSSTLRPATISPKLRTVTDSLPIKAHNIGRFSSPSDLIMSNHIAEPVFERKPRNFGSTTQAPIYLTETHYYLDHQDNHFSPLTSFRQGKQFDGHFQFSDHLDKPVIPVIDVRPFNFALINDVSVEDILRKSKRKSKKVRDFDKQDTVSKDDFFETFKNIPTQELIERNKHSSAKSVISPRDKNLQVNTQKVSQNNKHLKSETVVSGTKTNRRQKAKAATRKKQRPSPQRKQPSVFWEPPLKNPRDHGNDQLKNHRERGNDQLNNHRERGNDQLNPRERSNDQLNDGERSNDQLNPREKGNDEINHRDHGNKQTNPINRVNEQTNPRERGNDQVNLDIQHIRQKSEPEQGRNARVNENTQRKLGQQRHSNKHINKQNHRIQSNTGQNKKQNLLRNRNTKKRRNNQKITQQPKQLIKPKPSTI
jgi:hypothetical protein